MTTLRRSDTVDICSRSVRVIPRSGVDGGRMVVAGILSGAAWTIAGLIVLGIVIGVALTNGR